jgi:hypothetical protein
MARRDLRQLGLANSIVRRRGKKTGFTHERGGSLTTGRAGRSPIEAIGGEWHD